MKLINSISKTAVYNEDTAAIFLTVLRIPLYLHTFLIT